MKKIKILLIIILIIIFLGGIIFYLNYENSKNSDIEIFINNEKVVFSKEDTIKEKDLNTLNSEFDTEVTKLTGIGKVKVNGKEIKKGQKISLGKLKLSNKDNIEVEIKFFGDKEYTKYIINTIPSSFINYTTEGKGVDDGEYYLTTYYFLGIKYYVFKVGANGELKYYKKVNGISFDFRKNEIDGKIRYTYLEKVPYKKETGNQAYIPATLVVMDEKYNEINRINYQLPNDQIMELENHCYIYLDDDNYIVTGYEEMEVNNTPDELKNKNGNTRVSNCRIQEVKDGEILWEFQSINYPEFYELCVEESVDFLATEGDYADYMHINSMVIDPKDGNLICSFRNINALIKLNRKDGSVMWILGGKGDQFNLINEQKFSRQHSISFVNDNEILLYDNGNENKKTRILKITIDEENKKIKNYQEYDLGIYADAMGSVQKISEDDENYLICYGRAQKLEAAIEEKNLLTNKSYFKLSFEHQNVLYNVNKY